MSTHSEQELPERPATFRKRLRRTAFKLGIIASGVLLLAITFLCFHPTPTDGKVVWLTADELAKIKQGGPLARIKDKLMQWTAPLWNSYWNRQPQILIDSRLFTLSAAAADQTGLGAPVATNSDGMHAWILSPAELSSLLQRLMTTPEASLIGGPRAHTAAGSSALTFLGDTILVAGKNVPVGLTLEVSPKVRSGSIQLLLAFTSSESVASPEANAVALRTNLAVACRVVLPNSGGLVVNGGHTGDLRGTNYWLILSPTAVDARGQPIKL